MKSKIFKKMDYLKTDINGGMPFDLDDLRWESTAVRNALKYIGEALRDQFQGVILYGCTLSNGTCQEGAVYLNGEIYRVPQHSYSSPAAGNDALFWRVIEQSDPTGDEVFEDTSNQSTYIKRFAQLKNPDVTIFQAGEVILSQSPRFNEIFTTRNQTASEVLLLNSTINSLDTTLRNLIASEDAINAGAIGGLKKATIATNVLSVEADGSGISAFTELKDLTSSSFDVQFTGDSFQGTYLGIFNASNYRIGLNVGRIAEFEIIPETTPSNADWLKIEGFGFTFGSPSTRVYSENFTKSSYSGSGDTYTTSSAKSGKIILSVGSVNNFGIISIKEPINFIIVARSIINPSFLS